MDRAFSPHRCALSPATQADGLGWYGVAPSVLGFPASRRVSIQPFEKINLDKCDFRPSVSGLTLQTDRFGFGQREGFGQVVQGGFSRLQTKCKTVLRVTRNS
jgi:hypothetical protein